MLHIHRFSYESNYIFFKSLGFWRREREKKRDRERTFNICLILNESCTPPMLDTSLTLNKYLLNE